MGTIQIKSNVGQIEAPSEKTETGAEEKTETEAEERDAGIGEVTAGIPEYETERNEYETGIYANETGVYSNEVVIEEDESEIEGNETGDYVNEAEIEEIEAGIEEDGEELGENEEVEENEEGIGEEEGLGEKEEGLGEEEATAAANVMGYGCTVCHASFSTMFALTRHIRTHNQSTNYLSRIIHPYRTKPFQCPKCDAGFNKEESLKLHLSRHAISRDRPFVCPECGLGYKGRTALKTHMYIHTNEKPFVCPYCRKGFKQKGSLKLHLDQHTYRAADRSAPRPDKPHVCPECGKGFSFPSVLKQHALVHLKVKPANAEPIGGNPRLHTEQPGYGSGTLKEVVLEADSFTGDNAGAKIRYEQPLVEIPQVAVHTLDKFLMCPHCAEGYRREEHLRSHIYFEHGGHKPSQVQQTPDGRYGCEVCRARFATLTQLTRHIDTHNFNRCICRKCGKEVGFNETLKDHLATHTDRQMNLSKTNTIQTLTSTEDKLYMCPHCDKVYMEDAHLTNHLATHTDRQMNLSKTNTVQTFTSTEDKLYMCPHCDKVYMEDAHLTNHLATHTDRQMNLSKTNTVQTFTSTEDKLYMCPHCDKVYMEDAHLTDHLVREHGGETPSEIQLNPNVEISEATDMDLFYGCGLCDASFGALPDLTSHVRKHGYIIHTCPKCGQELDSKGSLELHLSTHTEAEIDKSVDKPYSISQRAKAENKEASETSFGYGCGSCEASFMTLPELTRHIGKHQSNLSTCPKCGKMFRSEQALEEHLSRHSETERAESLTEEVETESAKEVNKCSHCEKQYIKEIDLKKHLYYEHGGKKPFPCQICTRKFVSAGDLRKHHIYHTKATPFKCPYCDKRVRHKSLLKRHIVIHTGEKPHVCSYCDKGFNRAATLKTHRRLHTGEEHYACSECGQRFTNLSTLNKHVCAPGSYNDAAPYECPHCDKAFVSTPCLALHLEQSHRGQTFYSRCLVCVFGFSEIASLKQHLASHGTEAEEDID